MSGRRWVKGICSVVFDTDKGQTLEECYPPDALSEDELSKVCNLALPDSNTGVLGDSVHTFRMRVDNVPLGAASSLHHQYLFGFCFFRQKRDASVHRGFVQRSLVIVTDLPFVGLFKRVLHTMGPIHFDAGSPVLEAAFLNMNAWPLPRPGTALELPLLGSLLSFRVPWTGLQSFTPLLSAANGKRSVLAPAADTPARGSLLGSAAITPAFPTPSSPLSNSASRSGAGSRVASDPVSPRHRLGVGTVIEAVPLEITQSSSDDDRGSGSPTESSAASPDPGAVSDSDDSEIETSEVLKTEVVSPPILPLPEVKRVSGIQHSASCPSSPLISSARRQQASDLPAPVSLEQFVTTGLRSSAPSSPARISRPSSGSRQVSSASATTPCTLDDVLSEKQASELPGLYQELGLFTIFRGLCHSLWHIWELAITGQPIIVVGTHPELVGDAVLAIISLISPLVYGGDYRPYFSLYDPDFKELTRAHDSSKGSEVPCFILGTTNPFFIKSLEYWPNAIWLTPSLGFTAASVTSQTSLDSPTIVATASPKAGSVASNTPDRVRPKVVPLTTSLCSVLPEPGQESASRICLISRNEPLIPPDARILGQLLAIRAKDEQDAQMRLSPDEKGVTMGSSGGLVPAVMINNAVLRQHFRQLTLSFLKPFNRYFTVDTVKVSKALTEGFVGLYDDIAQLFLPKFSEEEFLVRLKETGPPKLLAKSNYRKLYQRFIASCHFWPWFKAKEQHALRKLHALARAARLSVCLSELVRDTDAPLGFSVGPSAAPSTSPPRTHRSIRPGALSSASSPQRVGSPDIRASKSSVMSFLSRITSIGGSPAKGLSPGTEGVGVPLPATITPAEERLLHCADLQMKIKAAITREERWLNKDPELASTMQEHLRAVEETLDELADSTPK